MVTVRQRCGVSRSWLGFGSGVECSVTFRTTQTILTRTVQHSTDATCVWGIFFCNNVKPNDAVLVAKSIFNCSYINCTCEQS
jgi:hypothetical protein